nr:retrovirus-related Pol polyprotein from transposon TNT 1-94 [Tanacetum cinerariifolium]
MFKKTLTEGDEGALHLGPEQPRVYSNLSPKKKERKNTENLNTKISKLNEELSDCETGLYHYKRGLSQVEARFVEFKEQEIKLCEKLEVKKEKEGLDNKLTGFESASKDLDNLLGSQRLDKNKEGLGYNAVPPLLHKPKAVINAARTNQISDVKASACWVWRPIKPYSGSITLKRYDYVDVRGRSRTPWPIKGVLRSEYHNISQNLYISENTFLIALRNQATVEDGKVVVQNVQGRLNRGHGNNARETGHIARNYTQPKRPQNLDYFKDKMLLMQAQENEVALDEEQLLFIAGGQDNVDDDVDEQPIQNLALNMDNVFQAYECDVTPPKICRSGILSEGVTS